MIVTYLQFGRSCSIVPHGSPAPSALSRQVWIKTSTRSRNSMPDTEPTNISSKASVSGLAPSLSSDIKCAQAATRISFDSGSKGENTNSISRTPKRSCGMYGPVRIRIVQWCVAYCALISNGGKNLSLLAYFSNHRAHGANRIYQHSARGFGRTGVPKSLAGNRIHIDPGPYSVTNVLSRTWRIGRAFELFPCNKLFSCSPIFCQTPSGKIH